MGVRFSISRKDNNTLAFDPLLWTLYSFMKRANCQEYLETIAELSGSMENSVLSCPHQSIFFTLKSKGMPFSQRKECKAVKD
jgi:hypothetical protein